MKHLALAAAVCMALGAPVYADYRSAMADYQAGNYVAASRDFRRLADQGDAESQYMIGYLYAVGEGVPQDYVQAHKWFNLAASGGKQAAAKARDEIARRMTSAQIAEAQHLAQSWHPQATALPAPAPRPPAPAPATAAPAANTVADIQRMLSQLGYDAGPADGVMGGRTRSAIRAYQFDKRLAVNGEPSDDLRRHLADSLQSRGGHGTAAGGASAPAWVPPEDRTSAAAPAPAWIPPEDRRGTSASTSSPAPAWAPPEDRTSGSALTAGDDRVRELVGQLRELIRDAETRHSADPRFLDSLRSLARQYARHGHYEAASRHAVIEDDFRDGNYTRNPAWQVAAGRFWVDASRALRTQVDLSAAQPTSGKTSSKDAAVAILGALLTQGAGVDTQGVVGSDQAEIYLPATLSNALTMRASFAVEQSGGRLELGVYQDGARTTGYRVALVPGAQAPVELVRTTPAGSSVLGVYRSPLRLDDGHSHDLEWTRDERGEMTVTIDGQRLFRARDRSLQGDFRGFNLVNLGGDYSVSSVSVADRR